MQITLNMLYLYNAKKKEINEVIGNRLIHLNLFYKKRHPIHHIQNLRSWQNVNKF